ncbi:MAG: rRNA maturation RNase YbeY, partial [Gammaproteobacteria bacterium]|nr:rRNA maturation RNase YbeY [Gammaproteobacteria bacterium]
MAESTRVELNAAAALTVDVQVACSDTGIPHDDDITAWVELAVAASGRLPGQDAELAVRVVDADEIRALNESYRRQDQPTNVLSFPAGAV